MSDTRFRDRWPKTHEALVAMGVSVTIVAGVASPVLGGLVADSPFFGAAVGLAALAAMWIIGAMRSDRRDRR